MFIAEARNFTNNSLMSLTAAAVTRRPSQIAVLRALRILNEDNRITIFSLIGRSDLMADVTT